MEVAVVDAEGAALDPGCVLSLRAGPSRRQGPIQVDKQFQFPIGVKDAVPFKVDLLRQLCAGELAALPHEGIHTLLLTPADGTSHEAPPSMKLRVTSKPLWCGQSRADLKAKVAAASGSANAAAAAAAAAAVAGGGEQPSAAAAGDAPPAAVEGAPGTCKAASDSRQAEDDAVIGTSAQAKRYFEEHNLLRITQALLEAIVKEQPADPFDFVASFMDRLSASRAQVPRDPEEALRRSAPRLAALFDAHRGGSEALGPSQFSSAVLEARPGTTEAQATAVRRGVAQDGQYIAFAGFHAAVEALNAGVAQAAELAGLSPDDFVASPPSASEAVAAPVMSKAAVQAEAAQVMESAPQTSQVQRAEVMNSAAQTSQLHQAEVALCSTPEMAAQTTLLTRSEAAHITAPAGAEVKPLPFTVPVPPSAPPASARQRRPQRHRVVLDAQDPGSESKGTHHAEPCSRRRLAHSPLHGAGTGSPRKAQSAEPRSRSLLSAGGTKAGAVPAATTACKTPRSVTTGPPLKKPVCVWTEPSSLVTAALSGSGAAATAPPAYTVGGKRLAAGGSGGGASGGTARGDPLGGHGGPVTPRSLPSATAMLEPAAVCGGGAGGGELAALSGRVETLGGRLRAVEEDTQAKFHELTRRVNHLDSQFHTEARLQELTRRVDQIDAHLRQEGTRREVQLLASTIG